MKTSPILALQVAVCAAWSCAVWAGEAPLAASDSLPAPAVLHQEVTTDTTAPPAESTVTAPPATASLPAPQAGWFDRVQSKLGQIWASPQTDILVPGYSYHLRSAYSPEKIRGFNERAWGIGMGRHVYDADGDWHGLYAMGFWDSHRRVEPIAGYAYQKYWSVSPQLKLGAGYTAFITARSDTLHFVPFPAALPLVSVQYRRLAIMGTFIPGGHGNGNVFFLFSRFEL